MGSKGKGDVPKFPDPSKTYEKGIKIGLKYLPKQLAAELGYRNLYDPLFIQQALGIQKQFDPQLAGEQLAALQRRDPAWMLMHSELADKIKEGLDRGYLDPAQKAAYDKWAGLAGTVDPQQAAAYKQLAAISGKGEPTREAAYKAIGQQVTGDTLRGGRASPETLRQMTQAILSRQPSLSYGEAQDMAAAVYTGQRSEALKAQRQGATEQFLGQATPISQRQESLGRFYGMPSLTQQRQQSLGQFYGAAPPEAQTLAQAGSYLSSPTVTQMQNQIQGVTPPRALGYVNPNAGYQGQQYGLQNYQNQLAYNQMGGGQSSNPWMNALSGASTGASYGSVGGPYGAAGGLVVGAAAGALGYPQYSDVTVKEKISRTGTVTKDGIEIVEFQFKGGRKRYRGVLGQEVQKVRPDAVHIFFNGKLGVFYDRLGIQMEEVKDAN